MALISSKIYTKWKRAAAALGFVVRTSATSVLTSDPTLSAGSAAPSEAEPNGSLYLRTNGTLYLRTGGAWVVVGVVGTAGSWTALQTFANLAVGPSTELTIASGAVAAASSYHTIDTEGGAASDDLDDITGLAAGELLLVTPADAARSIVLRHAIGANKIATLGARNITLAETTDWALLMGNGTQATVIAASTLADGILAAANTWSARQTLTGGLTSLDHIFAAATELTIASGAIVAAQGAHTVDTEGDAASDDLDSITGGTAEEVIFLRPANAARTVVLKHAIGADLIACPNGQDITLAEATDFAMLAYNGTQWVVVGSNVLAGQPLVGDSITEKTAGAGVTADGVLLKDGGATLTGPLVSDDTTGLLPVSYIWNASPDEPFFVATRAVRVKAISARPIIVGTDGGAVTGAVMKAPSGTAPSAGTALHTGSIDLKGTANTNQDLTLSATPADLELAIGDALCFDITGTPTDARGVVTVTLVPR